MENKMTGKQFAMNILNGLALGTVIVLIPGALLTELVRAIAPGSPLLGVLAMSNSMLGLVSGVMIGLNFKFNPIQAASIGLAAMYGGGAVQFVGGALTLNGTGDVINVGLTSALAAFVILLIGNKLKSYTIIVIPTLILALVGSIGHWILPYVKGITVLIGQGVASLLTLQPIIMCILIAIVFSILIVSPITTVGIALAVGLSGIGSGAGNLGICACGFGLAIMGWNVNGSGTALAHFIGSPKMSMPIVVKNPKTMIPIICNAAVCGMMAALFNIQGTPMSAGFGFSGLVGPINHLNLVSGGFSLINLLITFVAFVVVPVSLGFVFKYVFTQAVPLVTEEDYRLEL
ncbi:PTS transporter subunit IIC [Facklamia sp. P13055]|uniref:PTS transporter subunit IIC n=1 Tax=Facklamia sp. P13055 TaxID=3421952 RepID=UPI003D16E66F